MTPSIIKTNERKIQFHLIRHVPVINPKKIWYGRDIEHDATSTNVIRFFEILSQTLPSDPQNTIWMSSPYPRAKATGDGVLNAINTLPKPKIILCDAFIEQQYGIMTGKRHDEIADDPDAAAYLNDMWATAPNGGESLKMLQIRIGNELDSLVKTTPSHITDIVIFSHGGVAMAAFSHATGQRMIDIFKQRETPLTPSFSYQSTLTLPWSNGQWQTPRYLSGIRKKSYELDLK